MNKTAVWYVLAVLSFFYQVSFLYIYLTEQLVDYNRVLANTYWITTGFFGIIIGAYIIFKVNIGLFGKLLGFIIMFIGIGLIGLWLLALYITSM